MKHKIIMGIVCTCVALGSIILFRHYNKSMNEFKKAQAHFAAPTLDPKLAPLEKKLEVYFTNVRKELGQDDIGNLAMVLFLRQVAPNVVEKNPKLANLCLTKKSCPVDLATVYKTGLNRLDIAADVPAKEILQDQLVHSDLPRGTKISFLTQNLIDARVQKIGADSKMIDKTNIQLGPDAHYVIRTSRQLLELKMETPQYLQTMVTALAKSHDALAKTIVMTNLAKAYPKYNQYISTQAKTMGVKLVSAQ